MAPWTCTEYLLKRKGFEGIPKALETVRLGCYRSRGYQV
jgi:hypothetical protein